MFAVSAGRMNVFASLINKLLRLGFKRLAKGLDRTVLPQSKKLQNAIFELIHLTFAASTARGNTQLSAGSSRRSVSMAPRMAFSLFLLSAFQSILNCVSVSRSIVRRIMHALHSTWQLQSSAAESFPS